VRNTKADRRSQRTRQTLSAALIELMLQQRYDTITVQDIIDRANVGRSTFYAHYDDKDDLLISDFTAVLDALSDRMRRPPDDPDGRPADLTPLFTHVQEHRQVYKALVRGGGIELLLRTGHARLRRNIERHLHELMPAGQPGAMPLPLIADYIAGAIVNILKWWLDHDLPYTPAELDALFAQLVLPGVQAVLQLPHWRATA
jgi:AcrR family transcriptional regulator